MDFHEFHIITIPIGVLLLLILLLVICQCILPCCGRPKKGRRYSNEEAYFQSINRLLERQKLVEKQKEEREQAIEQLNEAS